MGRFANPDDFFRIADEYAEKELLALLGVDRLTLARWRARRTRIPWAAFRLAYDYSKYGLAERDSAEHFNRVMLTQLNQALRVQVEHLKSELARQAKLVNWGSANDPFVWPRDPRSQEPSTG